jgi:hypothetical protein
MYAPPARRANIRAGGTMIETLIVVLLVLWLLGVFGRRRIPRLRAGGNLIHLLLVIILVLIVVRLLS